MSTIAARLINTGTLLVNGIFDEWTGNPIVDTSLILWIDAGQTTSYSGSGNIWQDLGPANNNIVLNNNPVYSSTYGGSLNFDGSTQYGTATTKVAYSITNGLTVGAWVNWSSFSSYEIILSHQSSLTNNDGWRFKTSGNNSLSFTLGAVGDYYGCTAFLSTNTWYYVAVSVSGNNGTVTYYVNGQTAGSTAINTMLGTPAVFMIGDDYANQYLNGKLSVVHAYNRALSSLEIATNYNALAPRYSLPTISTLTNRAKFTTNTIYSSTFDEYTYNTGSIYTKNLISYSQSFLTSGWGYGVNTVVTPNAAIAPDGTLTATRLQFALGPTTYLGHSFPSVAGVTYTFSAYVLANIIPTATIEFEPTLDSGSPVVTTNFTASSSSWTRYSVTYTAAATSSTYYVTFDNQNNSVASDIYIWGAQLEVGSTATAYVPTNSIGASSPNFSYRIDNQANMYVSNYYDEFTGAPVVDSSLTMWIDFGQASSYSGTGSTVQDLSPSKQSSITLVGSPTFNSLQNGGTMSFNGTTQYGNGAGSPLGLNAYTKSAWFQIASYASNNIISSSVGGHFTYLANYNKIYNGHSNWGNFQVYQSNTTFNLNQWYYICLTFNTVTGMAFYVNGVLDSTYNAQLTPLPGNGECDIAVYSGSNNLAGTIGQVMCYNRVLTSDEVAQNFNALRRRYGL